MATPDNNYKGTPYTHIYSSFLSKINDYNLAELDKEDLEEVLQDYLISALTKFTACKKDLSKRNDYEKVFEEVLDNQEIEIIANFMVVEWLNPSLNTLENLSQAMPHRDFRMSSQSTFLRELRLTKGEALKEANRLMTEYSYRMRDLP